VVSNVDVVGRRHVFAAQQAHPGHQGVGQDGTDRMLDRRRPLEPLVRSSEEEGTLEQQRAGLLSGDDYAFAWVVDFPLLEWDAEAKRYNSMHHPFTSPDPRDLENLESDPGAVRAAPRYTEMRNHIWEELRPTVVT